MTTPGGLLGHILSVSVPFQKSSSVMDLLTKNDGRPEGESVTKTVETPIKAVEGQPPTNIVPETIPADLVQVNRLISPPTILRQPIPQVSARSVDLVQEQKPASISYTEQLTAYLPLGEIVEVLRVGLPSTMKEYLEHIFKIISLLHDDKLSHEQFHILETKLFQLMEQLPNYSDPSEYIHSQLHVLVERNFDVFIKVSTGSKHVELATRTTRFLTSVMMSLNYWEIYNLLAWKPAMYHFLMVIQFDLNDCYTKFLREYGKYTSRKQQKAEEAEIRQREARRSRSTRTKRLYLDDASSTYLSDEDSTGYSEVSNDHDKFVSEAIAGNPKTKRKSRVDTKLTAHRIIKKTNAQAAAAAAAAASASASASTSRFDTSADAAYMDDTGHEGSSQHSLMSPSNKSSNKSSNYDPDVVHECQLPSADEPNKMCLRRFSRKYELIRHQETVHSKKKKLFKCYVCVKQNPSIGPRIFTRHDTLAKHIRVNHKISGKEAKAEVAYSKKHAEVVEEGDITVHVGRRKTKVDFELRAHMEKRKISKDDDSMDDISDDPYDE